MSIRDPIPCPACGHYHITTAGPACSTFGQAHPPEVGSFAAPPAAEAPDIGKRVSDLLAKAGWTQAHLSRLSGVSQGFLSQIINENRTATLDKYRAIARAFSIDIGDLLTDRVAGPSTIHPGTRVRAMLDALGWTDAELARRSGLGKATISRVLGLEGWPEAGTLEAIAGALDVSQAALFGPVAEPPSPIKSTTFYAAMRTLAHVISVSEAEAWGRWAMLCDMELRSDCGLTQDEIIRQLGPRVARHESGGVAFSILVSLGFFKRSGAHPKSALYVLEVPRG